VAEGDKKPVINLVPAILTGTAALLAALTTLYVNVRNDIKPEPAAASAPHAGAAPAPAEPRQLRLELQRIAVQEDGAVVTADWRFAVEADGEPLFAIEQDALNAEGGRNIVVIDDVRQAHASVQLEQGAPISVVVKGWRSSWRVSGGEPLVFGEGTLSAAGAMGPISVEASDASRGAFTFYFSAAPERD